MSDIVDDLRALCDYCQTCPMCKSIMNDAAAEIERLRGLWLTEQKARLEQAEFLEVYGAAKAKQEIERLQLRVRQLETECGHLQADVNGQLEEIDSLRGLNSDMKALLETAVDGWEGAEGDWMAFRLMPEWFEAANDLTLEQGDFDLNDL